MTEPVHELDDGCVKQTVQQHCHCPSHALWQAGTIYYIRQLGGNTALLDRSETSTKLGVEEVFKAVHPEVICTGVRQL